MFAGGSLDPRLPPQGAAAAGRMQGDFFLLYLPLLISREKSLLICPYIFL